MGVVYYTKFVGQSYHICGVLYHICGILYHKREFPGNPYTVKNQRYSEFVEKRYPSYDVPRPSYDVPCPSYDEPPYPSYDGRGTSYDGQGPSYDGFALYHTGCSKKK